MTGHLVLSTLHTNDTVSTATRLLDMGVEGYLLATTLRAVLAQRLVRRVCESCAEDYQPDIYEATWLRDRLYLDASQFRYKKGKGCLHCGFTGYRGRIGVYELLERGHPGVRRGGRARARLPAADQRGPPVCHRGPDDPGRSAAPGRPVA